MATYVIGDGVNADYATFTLAEADVTLPDDVVYQVDGEVVEDFTFSNVDYTSLIIEAYTGQNADGANSGAQLNGAITVGVDDSITRNINIKDVNLTNSPTGVVFNNCDIGNLNTSLDTVRLGVSGGSTFNNCIIRNGNDDCIYAAGGDSSTGEFNQCTGVDAGRFVFVRATCFNCLALNSVSGDFHSTIHSSSDYLASSDTTATAEALTTGYDNRTVSDLVDYNNDDFNLAPGSSLNTAGNGGIRIGALLSTSGPTVSAPDYDDDDSSIILTGVGFTGATSVTIDGINASFVVDSDVQITVTPISKPIFSSSGIFPIYGVNTIEVTTGVGTGSDTCTHSVGAGFQSVIIASAGSDPSQYLAPHIQGDVVDGDLIVADSNVIGGLNPALTINPATDFTYTYDDQVQYTFGFRHYDVSNQTLYSGAIATIIGPNIVSTKILSQITNCLLKSKFNPILNPIL